MKEIKKRTNFLNLCPASHDKGMPELINAIVSGADHCDVRSLNQQLARTRREQKCTADGKCTTKIVTIISDQKPAACTAYEANPYTDIKGAKYVGTPERGGRWVDADQYDQAKRDYDERIRKEDEEARKAKEAEQRRKSLMPNRRNDSAPLGGTSVTPSASGYSGSRYGDR